MNSNKTGMYSGILFSILTIPLFVMSVFSVGDETSSDTTYINNLLEDHQSIQAFAGLGLLSVFLLLAHVEWLAGIISKHSEFTAKIAKSSGQIAATGFILSYGLVVAAAYGAGTFPDQTVRTIGMLAPNIIGAFLIGIAVFAGAIAILGWKGKFPKWMALFASLIVLMTVVATVVGAPAAASIPIIVWVFINTIGMHSYNRKHS